MSNFNGSINLLKLKAAIMNIKGKNIYKKCIVIPIEDNDIIVKTKEDGKISAFFNFTAWETENSQYGNTHLVKQSHSKDWNESHSEVERHGEPILGNMKPTTADFEHVNVPTAEAEPCEDDLPF